MANLRAGPSASASGHRANRLLAALEADDLARLEPHLEALPLAAGRVLYESGETVRHAYFPHGCVVSLLAVLEGGTLGMGDNGHCSGGCRNETARSLIRRLRCGCSP